MEEACKDEAEAARAAAAAEVASLLASPPTWLDLDGPHDAALSALNFNVQRAKGPRCAKLAWRWQCSIKGPAGTPYAGDSYRVLVRFPLGYPQLPPRLQVLSIIHHIEVDLRDPFEGKHTSALMMLDSRVLLAAVATTVALTAAAGGPWEHVGPWNIFDAVDGQD